MQAVLWAPGKPRKALLLLFAPRPTRSLLLPSCTHRNSRRKGRKEVGTGQRRCEREICMHVWLESGIRQILFRSIKSSKLAFLFRQEKRTWLKKYFIGLANFSSPPGPGYGMGGSERWKEMRGGNEEKVDLRRKEHQVDPVSLPPSHSVIKCKKRTLAIRPGIKILELGSEPAMPGILCT